MSNGASVLNYRIEALLREHGARTANELASTLGTTLWGVSSALNSMRDRGDVVRVRARQGSTEPRFKLRGGR